jgi:hypothetical protein
MFERTQADQLAIAVTPEARKVLGEVAEARGMNVSQLVREAIVTSGVLSGTSLEGRPLLRPLFGRPRKVA